MQNLNAIIVYYSFSGNTRKIAQAINNGISQVTDHSKIIAIKGNSGIPDMKPEDLLAYDLIGFGSPVWFESPAPNVMSFMNGLPSLKGKHTFVFLTHGLMPNGSLRWMIKELERKHSTVIGWKDWYSSCYPSDMFKPYFSDGHPDEIDLGEAADFGRDLIERSYRIFDGEISLIPEQLSRVEYNKLYGCKVRNLPRAGWVEYEIRINKEKCDNCGLCMTHCPTGSINLAATPPINRVTCKACWVCEQICPLGAVEVDYDSIVKDHGKKWGENWEKLNFYKRAKKRVEADPRFRSLVPYEDIGKDGFWYQISGHPRFKILP